jgi:hypothetical protein
MVAHKLAGRVSRRIKKNRNKNGGGWVFTDVGATMEFGGPGRSTDTAHALLNTRAGQR